MKAGLEPERGVPSQLGLPASDSAIREQTGPSAPSPSGASARMRNQRERDTGPEIVLRAKLHRLGLRFRIHVRPVDGLRREADIVFRPARTAVFVDGCFWHGCPDHATWPKVNAAFWKSKIEANQARDLATNGLLGANGWEVIRVWEHEDMDSAAVKIRVTVGARRSRSKSRPQTRALSDVPDSSHNIA